MAKKPAITGLARPQGIIDDIVRPIVAKTARFIADKGVGKTAQRLDKISDKSIKNRAGSYLKKNKLNKYNLIDNEMPVMGSKSPAKNYAKSKKAKTVYKQQIYKDRAFVVNQTNIKNARKNIK
jgi:hypothetical protein